MTEIDNEAVEAVARAIHQERFGGQLVWGEQPDAEQECREEARAAIAAMPGWRTIDENTPKDVEFMLGWWVKWPEHRWITRVDLAGSTRGGWLHGQATHYQPLPAPPKPEGACRRQSCQAQGLQSRCGGTL